MRGRSGKEPRGGRAVAPLVQENIDGARRSIDRTVQGHSACKAQLDQNIAINLLHKY